MHRNVAILSAIIMIAGTVMLIIGISLYNSNQIWGMGLGLLLLGVGITSAMVEELYEGDPCQVSCCMGYSSLASVTLSGLSISDPLVASIPLERDKSLILYSPEIIEDMSQISPGVGVVSNTPYVAYVQPLPTLSGDLAADLKLLYESHYGSLTGVRIIEERSTIRVVFKGGSVVSPKSYDPIMATIIGYLSSYSGRVLWLNNLIVNEDSVELVLKRAA